MRGDWPVMPLALQLLEEHWNGKAVAQLARETGIPAARIEVRLKAADLYLQRLSWSGPSDTAVRADRTHQGVRLGLVTALG